MDSISNVNKSEDTNGFSIELNATDSDGDAIIYTAISNNKSIATVSISDDNNLTLRLTSSGSYSSTSTANLTIGSATKSFSATTKSAPPAPVVVVPVVIPDKVVEEEEEEETPTIVEPKSEPTEIVKEPEKKVILEQRPTGNAEQTGTKPELNNVAKLYIATFGRAPKNAGSNYWLYESKLSLEDIPRSFFDQPETKAKYPEGFSNYDFIVAIYNHIYNRNPDQAGGDYWLAELNKN